GYRMVTEETEGRGGSGTSAFIVRDRRDSAENGTQGSQDSGQTGSVGGFIVTENDDAQAHATIGVDQSLPRQRRCSICGESGHTSRTCQMEGTAGMATRASRKPS